MRKTCPMGGVVSYCRRQWVFPQEKRWWNTKTGEEGRHHVDESLVQKTIREAVTRAGLAKRATCHTFRHSVSTHMSLAGGLLVYAVQLMNFEREYYADPYKHC